MSATAANQLWQRKRRTDESDDDESATEEQVEDIDIVIGPNPSRAVREIMTQQFRELAEGTSPLPSASQSARERALQGPLSGRKVVALSDCQILAKMSEGGQPRSFGTALHLGDNCTILCQVCSFSGSARACKKSWLCDFCHGLSLQCRNKRKGSGAWQVSQLSDQRILELYKALQAAQGSNTEALIPAHPRTIAEPHNRRTWRTELRGSPPVQERANTWGGEAERYSRPSARRTQHQQSSARSSFQTRPSNIRQNVQVHAQGRLYHRIFKQNCQEMLMRMQELQLRQAVQAVQPVPVPSPAMPSWSQMPSMPVVMEPPPQSPPPPAVWLQPEAGHRLQTTLQQFQHQDPYTGTETIRFNL